MMSRIWALSQLAGERFSGSIRPTKAFQKQPSHITLSLLRALGFMPQAHAPCLSRAAASVPTRPRSTVLTTDQLQRELNYRVAMSVANRLQNEGLISQATTRKLQRKIAVEFPPVWANLA